MATSSLTVALPEDLTQYVEARVDAGAFGTPTEYIRELILNDRDRRRARIEDHLAEALKEESIILSEDEWEQDDIMAVAEARLAQRR